MLLAITLLGNPKRLKMHSLSASNESDFLLFVLIVSEVYKFKVLVQDKTKNVAHKTQIAKLS